MENILVVGANTRPVACSLNRMGFNVYSADYFGCEDIIPCVKDYNSILSSKPFESLGLFSKEFNQDNLNKISSEFVDIADHVICCSGADPQHFPKNKIIGNKDVSKVENKYELYKTLKKRFDGAFIVPETFQVSDSEEASEVVEMYPMKKFLIKPLQGSGGMGIRKLTNVDTSVDYNGVILQEIVDGHDISTSVVSNGDEASTILTSWQLIGKKSLGQQEEYGYCGNLAPYTGLNPKFEAKLKNISEEIILDLELVGSNGLDMIINDEGIYLIEVNPRLQGTFEVAESSLDINMAETHINACNGNLKELPKPKCFALKMIVFAKERSIVGDIKQEGIHDRPITSTIIEKGDPVATTVSSGKILENTIHNGNQLVNTIYSHLKSLNNHF